MLVNISSLFLIISLSGYLLGSINFSIIVTKLFGLKGDIRYMGSGNAGFTNVLRSVGIVPAVFTFVGDCFKAVVALKFTKFLVSKFFHGEYSLSYDWILFDQVAALSLLVCGIFVILGHVYPCFFQFRGGKAVVCLLPITLFFDFRVSLLALSVFLLVLFLFKMVSLASILGTISLPLFNLILCVCRGKDMKYTLITTILLGLIAVFVVYKHAGNIKRIRNRTEYRIGELKK